jgi:hypothetical protein
MLPSIVLCVALGVALATAAPVTTAAKGRGRVFHLTGTALLRGGEVVVAGKSDLPDATVLDVRLMRPAESEPVRSGQAQVKRGRFEVKLALGAEDAEGLAVGRYGMDAVVVLAPADKQPAEVLRALGEGFADLAGSADDPGRGLTLKTPVKAAGAAAVRR